MKKLSKGTCDLMAKLKDAVQEEGASCVILIGKDKYLSAGVYGTTRETIGLLCCGVDNIANSMKVSPIAILTKMIDTMAEVNE